MRISFTDRSTIHAVIAALLLQVEAQQNAGSNDFAGPFQAKGGFAPPPINGGSKGFRAAKGLLINNGGFKAFETDAKGVASSNQVIDQGSFGSSRKQPIGFQSGVADDSTGSEPRSVFDQENLGFELGENTFNSGSSSKSNQGGSRSQFRENTGNDIASSSKSGVKISPVEPPISNAGANTVPDEIAPPKIIADSDLSGSIGTEVRPTKTGSFSPTITSFDNPKISSFQPSSTFSVTSITPFPTIDFSDERVSIERPNELPEFVPVAPPLFENPAQERPNLEGSDPLIAPTPIETISDSEETIPATPASTIDLPKNTDTPRELKSRPENAPEAVKKSNLVPDNKEIEIIAQEVDPQAPKTERPREDTFSGVEQEVKAKKETTGGLLGQLPGNDASKEDGTSSNIPGDSESGGAASGVLIGAVVGVGALFAVAGMFVWRRRSRRSNEEEVFAPSVSSSNIHDVTQSRDIDLEKPFRERMEIADDIYEHKRPMSPDAPHLDDNHGQLIPAAPESVLSPPSLRNSTKTNALSISTVNGDPRKTMLSFAITEASVCPDDSVSVVHLKPAKQDDEIAKAQARAPVTGSDQPSIYAESASEYEFI